MNYLHIVYIFNRQYKYMRYVFVRKRYFYYFWKLYHNNIENQLEKQQVNISINEILTPIK